MFYTFVDSYGSKILHRFVDDEGRRQKEIIEECPLELFIKGKRQDSVSLFGDPLQRMKFHSVDGMKTFIKEMEGVSDVYGQTDATSQFIATNYPDKFDFDLAKCTVLNFDIECAHDSGFPEPDKADETILSISAKPFGKPGVTFGLKHFTGESKGKYIQCETERILLVKFLQYWMELSPEYITGFNIDGFDLPYLINRMKKILGESETKKLSPFHKEIRHCLQEKKLKDSFKEAFTYKIMGITSFDYLSLYKKFSLDKLESYKLDYVAEHELGENKVDLSAYGNNLMRLYRENFNLFVEYNEQDTALVEGLDNKLQFIRLAMTISFLTKSKLSDAFGTVKIWDNLIYNMLLQDGIQIPPENHNTERGSFAGAFVKEPVPGRYDWVVSFDLTSLYPSIIRMYNISPETLVRESQGGEWFLNLLLKNEETEEHMKSTNSGCSVVANGAAFKNDIDGVLPRAVKMVFDNRQTRKKEMLLAKDEKEKLTKAKASKKEIVAKEKEVAKLDSEQHALKIVANGLYGSCGNPHFRYYNLNIAEGITLTGQLTIRFISDRVNEFLNNKCKTKDFDYVVTNDTDSMYLTLDNFVRLLTKGKEFSRAKMIDVLDAFAKKEMEGFLNSEFEKLAVRLNAKENLMNMKREKICDTGIFRGKKNYIVQVWDNEGVRYAEPTLQTVGIEVARSSTPKFIRTELKKCLSLIVNASEKDLQAEVAQFKKMYYNSALSDIAFPRGVTDIDKWIDGDTIKKGAPIHVKAAIHYNKLLESTGLDKEREKINNGNKMKFIYLKEPNPTHNNAIAFIDDLPKEFGLDEYVDWNEQYNKSFLVPLESFTKIVGWQTKEKLTFASLFGK